MDKTYRAEATSATEDVLPVAVVALPVAVVALPEAMVATCCR